MPVTDNECSDLGMYIVRRAVFVKAQLKKVSSFQGNYESGPRPRRIYGLGMRI